MKSIIATTLLLATISGTWAFAQDRPATTRPDRAARQDRHEARAGRPDRPQTREGSPIQRALSQLDLTQQQQTEIKAILDESREKMQAARQTGDRQAMGDAMRDVIAKVSEKLTPEQRTKLRETMGAAMGGDMLQRLRRTAEGLDLSEQQKTQIGDIFQSYRDQIEDIRKEAREDRQALQEQIRPLVQEIRGKILAVLTPEQAAKFQENLQGMRGQREGDRPGQNRPAGDRPNRQRNGRNKDAAR